MYHTPSSLSCCKQIVICSLHIVDLISSPPTLLKSPSLIMPPRPLIPLLSLRRSSPQRRPLIRNHQTRHTRARQRGQHATDQRRKGQPTHIAAAARCDLRQDADLRAQGAEVAEAWRDVSLRAWRRNEKRGRVEKERGKGKGGRGIYRRGRRWR